MSEALVVYRPCCSTLRAHEFYDLLYCRPYNRLLRDDLRVASAVDWFRRDAENGTCFDRVSKTTRHYELGVVCARQALVLLFIEDRFSVRSSFQRV